MNFFDISSDQAIPGASGSRHKFDPEVPSPLPLSFDTVNEHRPLSTSSQSSILFRLPVELLTYIVQLIPSSSLANFALLNRDCRQLARSRQFTRVRFDYSLRSLDLLRILIQEAFDRPQKNGLTASPSLGACIRYVKVGILGEHVKARHGVSLEWSFLDRDERERMLIEANDSFYRTYIPFVRIAIVNALPNLQILEWEDDFTVSRS
jgi:F-box associated protein